MAGVGLALGNTQDFHTNNTNTSNISGQNNDHDWIKLEQSEPEGVANQSNRGAANVYRARSLEKTEVGTPGCSGQPEDRRISFVATADTYLSWQRLHLSQSLNNSQLATLLLQVYEDTEQQMMCASCHSPLARFCSTCFIVVPKPEQDVQLQSMSTVVGDHHHEDDDSDHDNGFYIELANTTSSDCPAPNSPDRDAGADKEEGDQRPAEDRTSECEGAHTSGRGEGGPGPGDKKHIVLCAWCNVSFPTFKDMAKHLSVHASPQWQQQHRPPSQRTGRRRKSVVHYAEATEEDSPLELEQTANSDFSSGPGRKKNYKCVYCGACYKTTLVFTKHLQKHLKKHAFKCCDCEKSFQSLKALETHIQTYPHDFVKNHGDTTMEDNRPHQCRICGMRFRYLGFLANHVQIHTEPDPFLCSGCEQGFQSLSHLTSHQCQVARKPELQQPQPGLGSDDTCVEQIPNAQTVSCGEDGDGKDSIETAVEECEEQCRVTAVSGACLPERLTAEAGQQGERRRNTEVSEEACADQTKTQPHKFVKQPSRKRFRGDHPFKCPDCPSSFKYASGLKIHRQKHTGQNAFSCFQCELSFPSKRQMLRHLEAEHFGGGPIICHQCGKTLKNALLLDQHLRCHTGEQPFECRTCGENFKSHTALSVHRRCHKEDCFKCGECGADFKDYNAYKIHINEHSGIKPYLCSICGACFSQRHQHKKHMLKHGQKQFVCEHCGRAFYTSGEHKFHVMRHLGIKPFACQHCDMRFIRKEKLERHHISVHLQTKPFQCHLCPARYSDVSRRNEHVRAIHTNERPYKCPVCGKAFAKSGCRQAHLRIHKHQIK